MNIQKLNQPCQLISIYKMLISIFVILILTTTTIVGAYPTVDYIVGTPTVTATPTVKTDKTIYYQGQPVKITVKNTLNQPIKFDDIMVKNMVTNQIFSATHWCYQNPGIIAECIAVDIAGPITVNSGQTYTTTWYPPSTTSSRLSTYRSYVNWWSEGTVTCLAIGCPTPEPARSGIANSNYFWVR